MMKMELILKLVIITLVSCGALGNDVRRVDIYTSECEDCGMTAVGQLSIKVSG